MEEVVNLPFFKHSQFRLRHSVSSLEMYFSTETKEMLKFIDRAKCINTYFSIIK